MKLPAAVAKFATAYQWFSTAELDKLCGSCRVECAASPPPIEAGVHLRANSYAILPRGVRLCSVDDENDYALTGKLHWLSAAQSYGWKFIIKLSFAAPPKDSGLRSVLSTVRRKVVIDVKHHGTSTNCGAICQYDV